MLADDMLAAGVNVEDSEISTGEKKNIQFVKSFKYAKSKNVKLD